MKRALLVPTIGLTMCALGGLAAAQGAGAGAPAKPATAAPAAPATEHTALAPDAMKWGDGPPVFPKGMKMTVLVGDPSKAGDLFIIRARVPKGYTIMPHTHPTTENVTVVSGALAIGMGDSVDKKTKALGPGAFYSMPAGMHHYAFTTKETEIEVSAMGPFAITYVNPADDPSKAATK
jgi:quercetin dioxygenase-like cupin family protein